MTHSIIPQVPPDLQAVKALATHWLDRLMNREQSDAMLCNGDRVLELAGLNHYIEAETDAEAARDEFSFILGFNEGVEAGFALAIAVTADPVGDPSAGIRAAIVAGTASVTLAREIVAAERTTAPRI